MSSVTSLFVTVTINYMMKGGTLVGVTLISHFYFKDRYKPYQWFAVALITLSLVLVGCSGIIAAGNTTTIIASRSMATIIIIIKFISQVAYAIKLAAEQYFTQNVHYHSMVVVGFEGSWNFLISCLIILPILYNIPGDEGNGLKEDTIDTFMMLGNNLIILLLICLNIIFDGTYNVSSVGLTKATSATVRTLVESLRTFLIWIVQMCIYYILRSFEATKKYATIGEEWTKASWLQLIGYLIMTFGIIQFRGYPRLPFFDYGEDEKNNTKKLDEIENELSSSEEDMAEM